MAVALLLLVALGSLAVALDRTQEPLPADAERAQLSADAHGARLPADAEGAALPAGADGPRPPGDADGAQVPDGADDSVHQPPDSAGSPHPPPSAVSDPSVARVAPVRLRLPAIAVDASVSSLGLNADGTVQVPADPDETGWFRRGPSPGQVGSAVILGHVDSLQGPAVFIGLRTLEAGDLVEVSMADGSVTRFAVTSVRTYPNEQFPARKVYASHGYSGLQLVTCGGEYDAENGGYQSNVVVYTSLVGTTTPRA